MKPPAPGAQRQKWAPWSRDLVPLSTELCPTVSDSEARTLPTGPGSPYRTKAVVSGDANSGSQMPLIQESPKTTHSGWTPRGPPLLGSFPNLVHEKAQRGQATAGGAVR